MRVSDLYPNMQSTSTQEQTLIKSPSPGAQRVANDAASGKTSPGGYGMIVLLGLAGVLIGFKFLGERKVG